MLTELPRSRSTRLAALAVALLATGAPRALALSAPPHEHVCKCHHAHADDECACERCREAHDGARAAGLRAQASDAALPPCHRAAARAALTRPHRPPPPPDAACLEGFCGDGPGAAFVLGVEPFTAPDATLPALTLVAHPVDLPAPAAVGEPSAPEPPPPRIDARRASAVRGAPGAHSLAPWRHSRSHA